MSSVTLSCSRDILKRTVGSTDLSITNITYSVIRLIRENEEELKGMATLISNVILNYLHKIILYSYTLSRLRWSRGSVLAFSTQVRGFKPGRSRRTFRAKKILSTPSFGGEVKPSVPCRRFAACKRSLTLCGSRNLNKITGNFLAQSSTYRC